jgi:hypothetical protein
MMMKNFMGMSRALSLTAIVLGGQAVFANDVPVVNPSFEDPSTTSYTLGGAGSSAIEGWDITGGGYAGVWNVSGAGGTIAAAPGGSQIGFINPVGITTVSQTLAADLLPDTTYTVQIEVTGRSDGENPGTGYSVGLYAGGNLLTSVTPETPVYGSWEVLTATYTTDAIVTPDEPLSIGISDWTSGGQLDFGNVVVDPTSRVSSVPDGGTTALLLGVSLAGLGWIRRKI